MNCIKEITSHFDEELKIVFDSFDNEILDRISEIRIRANMPVAIVIKNTTYFIDNNADIYDYIPHNAVVITPNQLESIFMSLCEYSVYSKAECLKNGYITTDSGCRIGIASTANYDDYGNLTSIKNITSLCIRIPRQIIGCSLPILNSLYIKSFPSIIVAGAPNSGKTTFLKDLAYQLSNGFNNTFKKISIIDERNELVGADKLNLGVNTDVLEGFSKAKGIEIATRVLSPEMIVCDEIATIDELKSIKYAFSCGVSFAVSVHIRSREELYNKEILKQLILTNEFSYIVMLNGYTYSAEIIDVDEIYGEMFRNNYCDSFIDRAGHSFLQGAKRQIKNL